MKETIKVLDCGFRPRDFDEVPLLYPTLLNGHGGRLKPGQEPVYLEFTIDDCGTACDSAGIPFQPNITPFHFLESNGEA